MKLHLFVILLFSSRLLIAQALIITEIFADPTPSRGLPEREYIELLNRSEERLALGGYTLTYGSTRTVFPEAYLAAGEYAIACRTTYTAEFAPLGRVIGLSNLSLNNNGTTLVLAPPTGEESHRVSYSADWYAADRTEGYSLEMRDTAFPCRGKENWTSAAHGGTPGKVNSAAQVNPDTSPPELRHYDVTGNHVILQFNEVMAEDFATNPYHFELSENRVTRCSFADETHESVVLLTEKPLADYAELRLYAPRDCSGNEGPEQVLVFEVLPEPLPGEISLSEVLFNPPPGGDDFVEIHNTTDKRFQLKNWLLARLNTLGEVSDPVRLASTYTVLPARGWLAFTRNRTFLSQHYPRSGTLLELPALPAYNNDAGTVLLLKPDSTEFDRFTYSEKMHAALVHQPKGVSLEKVSMNDGTWRSASADAGFATPGALNSQLGNETKKSYFEAVPLVFYPDSDTPVTRLTYCLTGGEAYAGITVRDRHGRAVRTLARNHFLGTQGEIPWDGCDDRGLLLPPGNYAFIIEVFGQGIQRTYYTRAVLGEK